MFAVIKTGGKQYKVAPADVIAVEKLNAELRELIRCRTEDFLFQFFAAFGNRLEGLHRLGVPDQEFFVGDRYSVF